MKTKVALIFDDGFACSCRKIADLFERHELRAVFSVLANFKSGLGDWDLWNELKRRGHHIHPHGFDHSNLSEFSFEMATQSLTKCFETFEKNLNQFDLKQSIFNYPYNAGTPELNQWLLTKVRAVRVGGSGFNSEADLSTRIFHSTSFGPGECSESLRENLVRSEQVRPHAFIQTLHGVESEGWGPIGLEALDKILTSIQKNSNFSYWNLE